MMGYPKCGLCDLLERLDRKTDMGDHCLACDLLCSPHGDQRRGRKDGGSAQGCGRSEKISRHVRVVVEGFSRFS